LNKWLLLSALALGASATTIGTDAYMKSEAFNYNAQLAEPPETSIIIPTLNEEAYLPETMSSLANQNIKKAYPEKFETIVVDSGSTDRTLETGRKFEAKILCAPKGKLTARHIGVMNAQGEIIIGVDADTYYPPNYLNLVLKEFRNPETVGVSTPRMCGKDGNAILYTGYVWTNLVQGVINTRMPGSNSNFRKAAYLETGGFNLTINQFDAQQMVQEEEYAFPARLRKIGKVVWLWKAPAYTSMRRLSPTAQKRSFENFNSFGLLYPE
jgi:glycosyltransferase involved in cell wall biosynthesis